MGVYEAHVSGTPYRRDLRYKPQLPGDLDPVEQFRRIPMGDVWDDAQLVGPLKYLFNSRLLR